MGSIEFSKFLLAEGKVAVSPGIGFGEYGDDYVRFALIENEHRTRQAVRGIRHALSLGATAPRPPLRQKSASGPAKGKADLRRVQASGRREG